MAKTALGPWKFVLDIGGLSNSGLIIAPLIRIASMSTLNIHFHYKIGKNPKISLNIRAQLFKTNDVVS